MCDLLAHTYTSTFPEADKDHGKELIKNHVEKLNTIIFVFFLSENGISTLTV